ncbi:MAG: binding-protein-dependent transport system inner rane component, partial [Thermomicrobiales bacterium]|nr:binding-protein-dependent transport system inner rane component [Thermomicrobiales bacterium]
TLLLVYTVVFLIAHATPGTPWDMKSERPVPPEVEENLNRKYNLDAPLPEQYLTYLVNAVRGDFGPSYRSRSQSVSDIIREFLPVSLQLGAAAMLVAVALALPLGGLAAMRRGTWVDWVIVSLTTLGISLPSYVVASVLFVVLGVKLGWVPTIGWDGLFTPSSIVPIVGLALAPLAALTRYFRASMIEEIHRDYVRTARAKGLREGAVVRGHMARNALIPVATVAGVYFSYVLMGSFFVETIAGVPGLGRYFVISVAARDYPVIIGTTLLYAAVVMVVNILVDISYATLDPRIRYGE